MRRLIILLALILPLISFARPVQTFRDVPPDRGDYPFIEDLVSKWVLDVRQIFRPDELLTRAELAKIIVLATHWLINDNIRNKTTFPDVQDSEWYWPYIESAFYLRILDWYPDWKFRPASNINIAESIKIIFLATWLSFRDKTQSYRDSVDWKWYEKYAYSAREYGIYTWKKGKNWLDQLLFEWWRPITRWEMATFISRAISAAEYYKK